MQLNQQEREIVARYVGHEHNHGRIVQVQWNMKRGKAAQYRVVEINGMEGVETDWQSGERLLPELAYRTDQLVAGQTYIPKRRAA